MTFLCACSLLLQMNTEICENYRPFLVMSRAWRFSAGFSNDPPPKLTCYIHLVLRSTGCQLQAMEDVSEANLPPLGRCSEANCSSQASQAH